MHVLMISDVYFPRVNGVSTSIQTFAREFVELGHRVTLLAPDYGHSEPEPFEVIRLPSRYFPFDPEDRIIRWGRVRAHHERLQAAGVDLVHIHTPFIAHYVGVALARMLGVPVMASYHTFFEQYLDKYVPLVPGAAMRFVARHFSAAQCGDVDALAVPSEAMLKVLRRYGVQTPAEIVPTGIDLEQFHFGDGERFRLRHGISESRPLLLYVGRIAFEKNCDFLLRMLISVRERVPNVLLAFVGDGPARRQLERLTRRLGLEQNVRFLGYLDRDGSLEDCYAAGDAFVFASHTETQGLVLLESLALGTPVISTAHMGIRDVLRDGVGCLIAADDERDFAEKTVRLLTDPSLRAELEAGARPYAEQWSAPAMAERMLGLYGRIVARRLHEAAEDNTIDISSRRLAREPATQQPPSPVDRRATAGAEPGSDVVGEQESMFDDAGAAENCARRSATR
jgi:1,2-diacylglycerol 3-alpha-glucosyltransferase